MIIGFDVSTTCIGYCLLENSGEYIDAGVIDLKKKVGLYEKADAFESFLHSMRKTYGEEVLDAKFVVEEPAKVFAKNLSSAHVISLLQSFNAMCRLLIYVIFAKEPHLIMPMSCRKLAGIKVPRGQKAKEVVLQHVMKLGIIPEEKIVLKRTGKVKDWVYDMFDAYVVALAGSKVDG